MSEQPKKKDALLGKLIDGKYRVEKKLGGGGMGLVYLATHEMMDRTVALKMLHKHLAGEEGEGEFLERFKREAQATASIEHPNAITIHDFGIHEEAPFIVMQYIEGRSLKDILLENGALPLEKVFPIIVQVSAAVAEAHRRNIIHRDLKPDNIMISVRSDGTERATVLDFGIAKIVGTDDGNTNVTKVGSVIGTPQYMSPEQVHGKDLDARSDLYAVGIILYEMCTGKVPFDSDSAVGLMMKHISEAPPAPHTLSPEVHLPPRLETAIMKTLEKNPDDRYKSMHEFSAEMESIALQAMPDLASSLISGDTLGVSSTIPGALAYKDDETTKPDGLSKNVKIAAAAVGLLAVVGTSFLVLGSEDDAPSATVQATDVRPQASEPKPEIAKKEKIVLDERSKADLARATQLVAEKEYDTAEGILKSIIIQYPDFSETHFQLGELFINTEEFNDAVLSLQRASKLQKDNPAHYMSLGYAYGRLSRYQDAVKSYLETVRLQPEDPLSHNNLGFAYLKLGELENAENSFKSALRRDKSYARAYYNLAEVYKKQKDWERRALALKGAVGVDSQNYAAHLALAEAYRELELLPQAKASAERALELKPNSRKVKKLLKKLR